MKKVLYSMKKDVIAKRGKHIFSDLLYLYILIIAGIVFLHISVHDYVRGLYIDYLFFPALMFLGAVLERGTPLKQKVYLIPSLAMVAWFLLLQLRRVLVDEPVQNIGLFLFIYLFTFPLASLLQDGDKKKALKIFAGVYLLAASTMIADTALLFADCVPSFFSRHIFWNGARLQVFWHSNIAACFLMSGIVFSTIFYSTTKSRWIKLALSILIAMMLGVMALTNCRTAIILTGGYLGAQIFFALIKRGKKWFVPGVLAVLAVTIAFFMGAKYLYQANEASLIEKYTQQTVEATADTSKTEAPIQEFAELTDAVTTQVKVDLNSGETTLISQSPQNTFKKDLVTLNSRTQIWKATYNAIRENPTILVWGLTDPGAYVSSYNSFTLGHLHNAWIECLATLGVAGFLIAMLFTLITVWNCLIVLLMRNQDVWKRNVALLALCLMAASMLEPYLFVSTFEYHLIDFLFFLCAGYLAHWQEEDNRRIFKAVSSKIRHLK